MEHLFQFHLLDFHEYAVLHPLESIQPVQPVVNQVPIETLDYCEEVLKEGKKYHSCTFPNCGKVFRFKSEFMRHKLTHAPQRPLDCPYAGCTKTFKREDALKNHLRIHTGELPFLCEVPGCEQSFPTKAGLRYHSLKHKGQKECRCSFPGCNKSFLTMSQLKQHESALNYHQKMSVVPVAKEPQTYHTETITVEKKNKDMYHDEFFEPQVKQVEQLEWGVKDQNDNEQSLISEDLQHNFEKMVKVILTENNAMKKRLSMCSTLMGLMQENSELKNKLRLEEQFSAPVHTQQEFSDDKIFSFLNFDDNEKKSPFY